MISHDYESTDTKIWYYPQGQSSLDANKIRLIKSLILNQTKFNFLNATFSSS